MSHRHGSKPRRRTVPTALDAANCQERELMAFGVALDIEQLQRYREYWRLREMDPDFDYEHESQGKWGRR